MKAGTLKPAHMIVLRGLEIANLAHNRAVSIVEIIQALSPDEVAQVTSAYSFALPAAVGNVLALLTVRGLVFSPGRCGERRYFAAARILDREITELPDIHPQRYQVLALIRIAATELRRAVRVSDVLQQAKKNTETAGLKRTQVETAITQLLQSGDISVVKTLRGRKAGRHLYLPTDFDPNAYTLAEPLTWLESVATAFNDIWDERLREAAMRDRQPRPVTTKEVRARLAAAKCPDPKLKDEKAVINALWELSKHSNPLLRRISRRSRKSLLWSPAHVPDRELDLENTYASDAERVGEACLRAVARYDRPVILKEIAAEVDADPSLQFEKAKSLSKVVTGCVDYFTEAGARKEKGYVNEYIQSVGLVNNRAYYYHCGSSAASARAYVAFRQIESEWQELCGAEHLEGIGGCLLPTVATGRAMLVASVARNLARRIEHLLEDGLLAGTWREEAEGLHRRMDDVVGRAEKWLETRAAVPHTYTLPAKVDMSIPSVTKEELLELLKPFYPSAQKADKAYRLTSLLGNRIRRVWQPTDGQQCRSRRLYDRTDALLYAARHWGGSECRIQADTATVELGLLRDARFVLPGLDAKDFNMRMAAVACLAFLASGDVARLRNVATDDPDNGVRQAAEWACRFSSGDPQVFAACLKE